MLWLSSRSSSLIRRETSRQEEPSQELHRLGAGNLQLVDRRVEDVRDRTGGGPDEKEIELDDLAPLLLGERAHLAERRERLADAGGAQMPDDAAGVDPGAQP